MEKGDFEKSLAMGELVEGCDFILRISRFLLQKQPQKMITELEVRGDALFLEYMALVQRKHPPSGNWEFLARLALWYMAEVREKYPGIWEQLAGSHTFSPRCGNKRYLSTIFRELEDIGGDSGSEEE